jgi:Zn-dependent protease with chaperone function
LHAGIREKVSAEVARPEEFDDSQPLSAVAARACGIEIGVHLVALLAVVLPIYVLAGPLSFLQETVWAGSSVVDRLAHRAGLSLPSSAQLLFEDKIAAIARVMGLLVLIASLLLYRHAVKVESRIGGFREGRRYREIPSAIREPLEVELKLLWSASGSCRPAPGLRCFASADVAACALKDGNSSAIAVSTGLLERFGKDENKVDSLIRIILLHEISHIMRGDQIRFPQARALLRVCRTVVLAVLVGMAVTLMAWSVMDKWGVGTTEPSDASVAAYIKETVQAVSFAYLGLIVIQRYASFVLMLIELRADVTAASMCGGLRAFVRTVSEDGAIRREGLMEWARTLFGMKVTHLTSRERADLMKSPDRLLTPKLRYFAYLLVLPLLLLINGFVAFTPFEWILRAGMLAVTLALNVLCVLMVANAGSLGPKGVSVRRVVVVSAVVVLANLILFVDMYGVVMRSGELVTAAVDPNFREPLPQVASRAIALTKTLTQPLVTATENGRLLVWVCALFGTFLLVMRSRLVPDRKVFGSLTLVVVLATVLAFLSSPHGPNSVLKTWLQDSDFARVSADWLGPIFGVGSAIPIVVAFWGLPAAKSRKLPMS